MAKHLSEINMEKFGHITPTADGFFVAYDTIRKERLYKPSKGANIQYFNTRREARKALDKLYQKKYAPLAIEAKKYRSAEEFADKILTGEPIINKNFPIKNIKQTDYFKSELAKAQKEIAEGKARPISKEPIRLFYDVDKKEFTLIDGFHRLVNAQNEGKSTIKAGIEISGSKQQLTDIWEQATKGKHLEEEPEKHLV